MATCGRSSTIPREHRFGRSIFRIRMRCLTCAASHIGPIGNLLNPPRRRYRIADLAQMILDENRRLLLHALFGEGEDAVNAYKSWRNITPLDDITFSAFRVLGQLVKTVNQHRIEDPEIGR